MSDERITNLFTLSAPGEIIFSHLFEKHTPPFQGAEPRWDMTLLLDGDHPDLPDIKKMCVRIFCEKFPGVDPRNPAAWTRPWESGDEFIARQRAEKGDKAHDNSYMAGKVLLSSKSYKFAPNLSVLMPGRGIVDFRDEARETVKDKFYSGVKVLAEFNFVPHKVGRSLPGVTAYLNKVCSLNQGERRGGGKSGAETFGGYVGKLSAIDPTLAGDPDAALLSNDIPF